MNKVTKKVVLTAIVLGMVTPLFAQNKGFESTDSIAMRGLEERVLKASHKMPFEVFVLANLAASMQNGSLEEGLEEANKALQTFKEAVMQCKTLLNSGEATDEQKQKALLNVVDSYMAVPEGARLLCVLEFRNLRVVWEKRKAIVPEAEQEKYETFLQEKAKYEMAFVIATGIWAASHPVEYSGKAAFQK